MPVSILNPLRKLLKFYRDYRAENNFYKESSYSQFKGVYSSFEEATKNIPNKNKIGYANKTLALEYKNDLLEKIILKQLALRQYDYPVLAWLKEIVKEGTIIADFGGNVGIHFYVYKHYISLPTNIKWLVCDFEEIIKAGEEIKSIYPDARLSFFSTIDDISNKDVFIASGSIQYCEDYKSLFTNNRPSHILLNRLPLYDGSDFVTLQNGGKVFYPQYVFNQQEMINYFKQLGYELIDIWQDYIDACYVPFHPEKSINHYYGLYFRLK